MTNHRKIISALICCFLILSGQSVVAKDGSTEGVTGAQPAADPVANKPLSIKDLERAFQGAAIDEQALLQSMGSSTPLNPDQIRAIRRYIDQIRRASSEPPAPPPKASVSSLNISLEPGVEPAKIRLHNGIVTSVVFQDATGAPWPIRNVVTGNADWTTTTSEGSNILLVSPKSEYGLSNISVLLDGAPAPVTLLMQAGNNSAVDHRLDLVIQGRGPKAISVSMDVGRTSAVPGYMISFQDGIPPNGAVRLLTRGADGTDAWRHRGKLIVRTRMTLSSPAALRAIRSADGTFVYEMEETPLLYFTHGGRRARLDVGL